nr:hypothetical protein CFP56_25175 [Quercus suber]
MFCVCVTNSTFPSPIGHVLAGVEWSSHCKTNRGVGEMEDELEELWKKLSFTEEEDESISLGSSTTEAVKMVGKNCIVMKVLSHKCMNTGALRKHMRMLWKPNKGVQINKIGDELFLLEFGDERDKKRIMNMSPWTYEKQLILLKEFEGEQVPKHIQLWQSPFWVQIQNLPLNSRTRETDSLWSPQLRSTVIDVVVYNDGRAKPWRASGFYGYLNARKRYVSWELLNSFKNWCDMPWIVFGDFNKITHPDKEFSWLECDANQMRSFRECLNACGLIDLGFVWQRFTWCNRRLGEQRTLIRLDRMVANEKWVEQFPEARVHHISMSVSDHCMLALFLTKIKRPKPTKRRFVFEVMWARNDRCKEVIERA